MKSFIKAFKEFSFSGRVSAGEYWKFVGISTLFLLLIFIVPILVGVFFKLHTELFTCIVIYIYLIIMFLPFLSMQAKRLHDINKSANWLFLYLIPYIGFIVVFVLLCKNGDLNSNNYGDPPLDSKTDNVCKKESDFSASNSIIKETVYLDDKILDTERGRKDFIDYKEKITRSHNKFWFILILVCLIVSVGVNIYQRISYYELFDTNVFLTSTINRKDDIIKNKDNLTEKLENEMSILSQKLDWYEYYAVVVTESDNYYHNFDCPYVENLDFWIYNVDAAEKYGYKPCPYCRQ